MAEKYNLDVPEYKGVDQIVELPAGENVKVNTRSWHEDQADIPEVGRKSLETVKSYSIKNTCGIEV